MDFSDLIGGAMMSIGFLVCLLLLTAVLVATVKNLSLTPTAKRLGNNLLKQQRLYASYVEWRKANRSGDNLTFDQWKEANGK